MIYSLDNEQHLYNAYRNAVLQTKAQLKCYNMKDPFKYNMVHHSNFQNIKGFHTEREDMQPVLQRFLNT